MFFLFLLLSQSAHALSCLAAMPEFAEPIEVKSEVNISDLNGKLKLIQVVPPNPDSTTVKLTAKEKQNFLKADYTLNVQVTEQGLALEEMNGFDFAKALYDIEFVNGEVPLPPHQDTEFFAYFFEPQTEALEAGNVVLLNSRRGNLIEVATCLGSEWVIRKRGPREIQITSLHSFLNYYQVEVAQGEFQFNYLKPRPQRESLLRTFRSQ